MSSFALRIAGVARHVQLPGPFAAIRRARALYRQRQALATLDDHLLDDLGISRRSAQSEAARPIWDAPDHWCD